MVEIASLRDAVGARVASPQTALRLSGVIKVMPLRGMGAACADHHFLYFNYPLPLSQGRGGQGVRLECKLEVEAYKPAVGGLEAVEVGESADVVDAQELEDVLDADAVFHVGLGAEGDGVLRE